MAGEGRRSLIGDGSSEKEREMNSRVKNGSTFHWWGSQNWTFYSRELSAAKSEGQGRRRVLLANKVLLASVM